MGGGWDKKQKSSLGYTVGDRGSIPLEGVGGCVDQVVPPEWEEVGGLAQHLLLAAGRELLQGHCSMAPLARERRG